MDVTVRVQNTPSFRAVTTITPVVMPSQPRRSVTRAVMFTSSPIMRNAPPLPVGAQENE